MISKRRHKYIYYEHVRSLNAGGLLRSRRIADMPPGLPIWDIPCISPIGIKNDSYEGRIERIEYESVLRNEENFRGRDGEAYSASGHRVRPR